MGCLFVCGPWVVRAPCGCREAFRETLEGYRSQILPRTRPENVFYYRCLSSQSFTYLQRRWVLEKKEPELELYTIQVFRQACDSGVSKG